jgi:predicted XRE-type DNA-binding protein
MSEMSERLGIEFMSKDVFKDLGFDEAESAELNLRSALMDALLKIIDHHGYTQKELITILGQKQPHVSNIMAGKIGNFSSEKLTSFLKALDATVHIKVAMPKTKIAAGQ